MTRSMVVMCVWSGDHDAKFARVRFEHSSGRITEHTTRYDDTRTAEAALVRRAVAAWEKDLPKDPIDRVVTRLRQLRAELDRLESLTCAAAVAMASGGTREALDSALLAEEDAYERFSILIDACGRALPEAIRVWQDDRAEASRTARENEAHEAP